MYVRFVAPNVEREWREMARRSRSGLGRPPVPEEHKKECLTCYIPVRVIERLGEIAEDRRTSRNKLVAQVLGEFVEAIDRGRPWADGGRERAGGRESGAARARGRPGIRGAGRWGAVEDGP
jgi:hypothetical protein